MRRSIYFDAAGTIAVSTGAAVSSTTSVTGGAVVNNGDTVVRPIEIELNAVVSGNGNIKFQIANSAASSGRTSTLKAGTYMLARKLST